MDVRITTMRHSDFGDPDCCGYLNVVTRRPAADVVCNECGLIIRTIRLTALEYTLAEMELTLNVAIAMCPCCRFVNLFPGFSRKAVFVCQRCGQEVNFSESVTTDF
jgi:hypothetical protein